MAISALGYIGIGATDLRSWRVYAGELLGCHVEDGPDGGLSVRIDSRAWRIAIEPADRDDIAYVGWEVAGPAALARVADRLREAGVEATEDPALAAKRGVKALIRFIDPDGLASELYWGPTERFEQPLRSPAGTRGFVTGEQGLGHIVVSTADPARLEAFYRDVLGFGVSDYIDDPRGGPGRTVPVTFMHCNGRHHSFAFAAVPAPIKLLHFMLQAEHFDDVGLALDRVEAAGVPLSMTLGRHVNDHMVSFYAFTPGGSEVEYGWGARTVEPASWTPVRHDRISVWGHHTVNRPGTTPPWKAPE